MEKKDTKKNVEEKEDKVNTVNEKPMRNENKRKAIPKRKKIDKDQLVLCKNITNGTLVYTSKKTGATYVLEGYGACEYFEVNELMTMKASQGRILTEPWLLIDDDDIIDYLGLRYIYDKIAIPADDIDSLFTMSPVEIENILTVAPNGIKVLIAQRARELVKEGKLDSVKAINIIENKLNIKLIE